MLSSTIFSLLLLTTLALLLDRHVIDQYWELARGPYAQVIPSGIVAPIRKLFGGGVFWLQFVPPLLGIIWFSEYWRHHQDNWSWQESMPALVTASVLTSAYGWLFDQAVLVLPVIALAAAGACAQGHLPRRLVVLYTFLNCMLMLAMGVPPLAFVPAPVFLSVVLWYETKRVPMLSLPVSPTAAG